MGLADLFKIPNPPVKKALKSLLSPRGDYLDMTTNSNGALIRAVDLGNIYVKAFGLTYVRDRLERLERLAISVNGQGRRDLIDAVKAGGNLPPEYYRPGGGAASSFAPIENDEAP